MLVSISRPVTVAGVQVTAHISLTRTASNAPVARSLPPATDIILTSGDIQVAQENLRAFGFDPGPVKGVYTAETQAAVRAYQARYGMYGTELLSRATRHQLLPRFDQRPIP